MNKLLIIIFIPILLLTSFQTKQVAFGTCPDDHYEIFYAFKKVLNDRKYKCYGKPSAAYNVYTCPMYQVGRCSGRFFKQEFCYGGNTFYLYFTDTKCTCGCANKNFHGKNLNILDVAPCGCEGDEEVIGKDDI